MIGRKSLLSCRVRRRKIWRVTPGESETGLSSGGRTETLSGRPRGRQLATSRTRRTMVLCFDDQFSCFQNFLRMASASAADIAKLETKAVAAEKLIELLRQQIAEVRSRVSVSPNLSLMTRLKLLRLLAAWTRK